LEDCQIIILSSWSLDRVLKNQPTLLNSTRRGLKMNPFLKMIKEHWIPFRQDLTLSTTFQFTENLRRIKEIVKPWAFQKIKLEDKELK
jgi:hypothetical protein